MMNESTLSRKRTNHLQLLQYACALLFALLTLSSCGSSKPRVITTKAEAREFQSTKAVASPKTAPRRSIAKNIPEREPAEPEIVELPVEEVPRDMTVTDIAINKAMEFEGTRYRYGGATSSGMDCSGLLNISFTEAGKEVPRTSMSFFQAADPIDVKEVQRGDLMFFATGRDRKRINHVALVVEVTPAEIRFVHATVSQGVVVSSFNEAYWLGKYRSSGRLP